MKNQILILLLLFSKPFEIFSYSNNDSPGCTFSSLNNTWYGSIIFWLILISIVLFIIYTFVSDVKNKKKDSLNGETPLDILKKRYAKGEISKEEFDNMKSDISD